MHVGIFLPNWIGDAVMATPALRALREYLGPAARLTGILRPHVAAALDGTDWLNDQLIYDRRSKQPEHRGWRFVRTLRQQRFDTVMLMTNSLRTGLLAWLSGAGKRIGYDCYGRGPLLTRGFQYPRHTQAERCRVTAFPMVDFYNNLVEGAFGCPVDSRLELATTPADELAADGAWKRLGLSSDVVVFNCSGAYGSAKLWPVENFAALGAQIAARRDHDVLVICGPGERETARKIVALAGHPRVKSLADEPLSIGLSKACVRRARLMVTTDSGPRHFAVAFGVPLVSLFGPTPPVWGANPTAIESALQIDLECSGCHRRTCPLGHHRCMRDLTVSLVLGAVDRQLAPARKVLAA